MRPINRPNQQRRLVTCNSLTCGPARITDRYATILTVIVVIVYVDEDCREEVVEV
jgi:hypothetical protein